MTASGWQRIKHVFQQVLDRPPGERVVRARELCRGEADLLAEVSSLLMAHEQVGSQPSHFGAELPDACMPVEPLPGRGDRLGVYQLVARLGAGGMGEVYAARDTRLDRAVAVKVLRPPRNGDPAARERLRREARAVASLSHRHICTLHDVGEDLGVDYLVMELLRGETLAQRLTRGPLPVAEVIALGIEVASALDCAHRAGIVHRDVKPGNLFLTEAPSEPSGWTVKLLDFGVAGALPAATEQGRPPLTAPGALLGTVRYMAPEQLAGRRTDARTDLFALGVVLYEAVAGRHPFEADSEAEVVAAILGKDLPPLAADGPAGRDGFARVLRGCLAKVPEDRWQSARDLQRALAWLADDGVAEAPWGRIGTSRRVVRGAAAALTAGVLAVGGIASLAPLPRPTAPPQVSFFVHPPQGTHFPRGAAEMAIAPDGHRLAFVALSDDGTRRLWIQDFATAAPRRLEGTDGAAWPLWSPDSESVAFFAGETLKRVPVNGGTPQLLGEIGPNGRGGTWNTSGTVLFAAAGTLWRVPDVGGTPAAVTRLDTARGDLTHGWPVFLPDGQRFLFMVRGSDRERTGIYVGDLAGTDSHLVLASESPAALAGGSLFISSHSALVAHRYDAAAARVTGAPVTVSEGVLQDNPLRSGGAFAAAGTPAAVAYRSASPDSQLKWVDRSGREIGVVAAAADYHNPSLAPDDVRVAVEKTDPATGRHTIWIIDSSRGVTSRLLFDAAGAHGPMWSPDGARISFLSNRLGGIDVFATRLDGSRGDTQILASPDEQFQVTDWSSDGALLVVQAQGRHGSDLLLVSTRDFARRPLLATAANERHGRLSPDLHWLAYTSDESGVQQVYARRVADGSGWAQLSSAGGVQPTWRRDGRELFYLGMDGRMMAVAVAPTATGLAFGMPRALFDTGIRTAFVDRRSQYAVTGDGRRFLVNISAEDQKSGPITVVLNWTPRPAS